MRATYSRVVTNVPMSEERREHKRYRIDCPVTVLTPGRGRKRMIGRGWLHDINDKGARFVVEHPLQAGDRISLEVHFLNPDGEVTVIRFPAVVKRVSPGSSHETAVSFCRGGSFVQREGSGKKSSPRIQLNNGSNWIN